MNFTRRDCLKTLTALALAPSLLVLPDRRRNIDIMTFCGKMRRYPGVELPFVQDGLTYATNARVCVRVATNSSDLYVSKVELPAASALPWWDHDTKRRGLKWQRWPKNPLVWRADDYCLDCDGKGVTEPVAEECEECQGVGRVFLGAYNTRPAGCRACNGLGVVGTPCMTCRGKGWLIRPSIAIIGRQYVDLGEHSRVAAIGDVEFTKGDDIPSRPIRFRFREGVGLLMPLDKKLVEERIAKRTAILTTGDMT